MKTLAYFLMDTQPQYLGLRQYQQRFQWFQDIHTFHQSIRHDHAVDSVPHPAPSQYLPKYKTKLIVLRLP